MSHLVCALSLVVFYILQTTIFSQIRLISGTADLILLFFAAWSLQGRIKNSLLWAGIGGMIISIISAMPFFTPLFGYLGIIGISNLLQKRVWRIPLLTMLVVTLLGTLWQHVIYIIALQIQTVPISWSQSLDTVIIPSIFLNLIFALPIFAVVNDLSGRITPLESEL